MADADHPARKPRSPKRSPRRKKPAAPHADPLDADFGPGFDPEAAAAPSEGAEHDEGREAAEKEAAEAGAAAAADASADREAGPAPGIFPGVACGGESCLLNPVANLFGRFGLRLVRGHGPSLSRVAFSSIELMRALRDFLDEEIALAEKASGGGDAPRYEKIPVD